jgi:hypothetical protein
MCHVWHVCRVLSTTGVDTHCARIQYKFTFGDRSVSVTFIKLKRKNAIELDLYYNEVGTSYSV